MITFPNAKINLGLNIIGKRNDGFHELETVFFPVDIKDALEIIPSQNNIEDIVFSSTGLVIDGNTENNLCVKAYKLLKKDFPTLPSIVMHLHKKIPMGAGLGGGSADAAYVLTLLNNKFNIGLSQTDLINYAAKLGSDCAFFIINKPCLAEGRGELLQTILLPLNGYNIMVVHPGIHVNTADAFKHLNATDFSVKGQIKSAINNDISTWKFQLHNIFEKPVFEKYPAIKDIKETFYKNGAIYSAMSGSGSAVFGIFAKDVAVNHIKFPSHYFCQLV